MSFELNVPAVFSGKGRVKMGLYGVAGAQRDVGLVQQLATTPETTKRTLPNLRDASGGDGYKDEKLTSLGLKIVFSELAAERLAMVTYGTTEEVVSSTVTAEPYVAYQGGFLALGMIDRATVVVEDDAETTTYTEGDDYSVGETGIDIAPAGLITDGETIRVSYALDASTVIETYLGQGREYAVTVDGLNDVNGDAVSIVLRRWAPALGGFDGLSADLQILEVDGTAVAAQGVPAGVSPYMTVTIKNSA